MYSIANIESSFHGIVFAKMTDEDFENYSIIYKEIKRLEEINIIKNIALKNSMDTLNYVNNIMANLNNKLHISRREIHNNALEFVIRAILLNQTFIENVKIYSKQLTSKQKEDIKIWIDGNEKLQFLRILRNYTYHNTIPIKTSSMKFDVLAEKHKDIELILDKDNLINNIKETGRDIKFIGMLEKILSKDVNLINYFNGWLEDFNCLYDMILKFIAENLKSNIKNFSEKFYNIFISTNGYVTNFYKDGTYDKYIIDKEIYKQIVINTKIKV